MERPVKVFSSRGQALLKSYGTIDCGLELMHYAWHALDHKFAFRSNVSDSFRHDLELYLSPEVKAKGLGGPKVLQSGRLKSDYLNKSPVDLLVVDRGHLGTGPGNQYHRAFPWEQMVARTLKTSRPKVVLESWPTTVGLWERGPMDKGCRTRWPNLGYESQCCHKRANDIGGAIDQSRVLIVRVQKDLAPGWKWDDEIISPPLSSLRTMKNLLTPSPFFHRRVWLDRGSVRPAVKVYEPSLEPMPFQIGALLGLPEGLRRLTTEEVARGLGIPGKQLEKFKNKVAASTLQRSTSVFHWEYVSRAFALSGLLGSLKGDFEVFEQPKEKRRPFMLEDDSSDSDSDMPGLVPRRLWGSNSDDDSSLEAEPRRSPGREPTTPMGMRLSFEISAQDSLSGQPSPNIGEGYDAEYASVPTNPPTGHPEFQHTSDEIDDDESDMPGLTERPNLDYDSDSSSGSIWKPCSTPSGDPVRPDVFIKRGIYMGSDNGDEVPSKPPSQRPLSLDQRSPARVRPGDRMESRDRGLQSSDDEDSVPDLISVESDAESDVDGFLDKDYIPPYEPSYSWNPPDVSEGGIWWNGQKERLEEAAKTLPNPKAEVERGLMLMKQYVQNVSPDGNIVPKSLVLLWWNWDPLHWEPIREGTKLNFMEEPVPCIHPNSEMNDEQLKVAEAFVEEMISLGVLIKPTSEVKTTAPLFCLDKENSPGEFRVISDNAAGGQNAKVSNDPVFLHRPSNTIEECYTGGFSAVVDFSKFFYHFPVHPEDQPYVGTVHPTSGDLWVYHGLPMGHGDTPAIAGRYSVSVARFLREHYDLFSGTPMANTWWQGFQREEGYDPRMGRGYILVRSNGRPCVWIKVHIDDFLIHGPDYQSCCEALDALLTEAFNMGLLFHPKKLVTPQQVVKYCGFVFDTRKSPCLRIPIAKRERAVAMVDYVLSARLDQKFSRLALATVAGVLESLIEATPARAGHTFLRRLHSVVHPPGLGHGADPYYTSAEVGVEARLDLLWWRKVLLGNPRRHARSTKSASLVPMWGDGSGTGTGGTFQVPNDELRMWMGLWGPVVVHNSSNWKELQSLLESLKRASRHAKRQNTSLAGTTVFYFTDNTVTYYVAASGSSSHLGLQSLIEEVKHLELELGIHLQVVHVPGVVMIQQGTDGLSRGVWVTPLHTQVDRHLFTASVFSPLMYDEDLVVAYIKKYGLPRPWRVQQWDGRWVGARMFDYLNVWFPPPEVARQAISFMLDTYIEKPLTTSALFFIPRTISAAWRGLSRHITELETFCPRDRDMAHQPMLPIPIIVLYLAPHVRSLPVVSNNRMEPLASPSRIRWHERQAAFVRGLQGTIN